MNQKSSTLLLTKAGKVKGRLERSVFFNGSRGPTSLCNKEASMHEIKAMVVCSQCLTTAGVLYLCDACGSEFCKKHINKTTSELLCDECYQGHPENPDSERIDQAEYQYGDR